MEWEPVAMPDAFAFAPLGAILIGSGLELLFACLLQAIFQAKTLSNLRSEF